jgi:hypothetical protein
MQPQQAQQQQQPQQQGASFMPPLGAFGGFSGMNGQPLNGMGQLMPQPMSCMPGSIGGAAGVPNGGPMDAGLLMKQNPMLWRGAMGPSFPGMPGMMVSVCSELSQGSARMGAWIGRASKGGIGRDIKEATDRSPSPLALIFICPPPAPPATHACTGRS